MRILTRLRDELHHTRRVHRNHDRITQLQNEFDHPAGATVDRAVLAMQIAARQEQQAEHLAASRLARWTTLLPDPDTVRRDAQWWQFQSDELFAKAAKEDW